MARSAQTSTTRRRKGKGGGRPSELTDEKRKLIVNALRTTLCSLEDAGWLADISPRTVARWRSEGEKDDANNRRTPERQFWHETSKALAEGRVLLAGRAVKNTAWDGTLAMKILERRDPKNWAARKEGDTAPPIAPAASPRERVIQRLDAIEQRMSDAARSGVAPVPATPDSVLPKQK